VHDASSRGDGTTPVHFVEHEGGLFELGAPSATQVGAHHFDNERPRHRVWLEPFALGSHLVTHRELRAFRDDNGYETPSRWLADGWEWCQSPLVDGARGVSLGSRPTLGRRAPLYVEYEPGSLRIFTHDGMIEAEDDAPVAHLSLYEADALARFLGARLPTEAEIEAFAVRASPTAGNFFEGGALRPLSVRRALSGSEPCAGVGEDGPTGNSGASLNCLATPGRGRLPRTVPTKATHRAQEPLVSTTASSW
jgi:formylglycine-generating enzyme required for sulfatase activity